MSTEPYCFWDAKSREDTYVLIAHTTIAFSVFLLSIFRLSKFRRVYNRSQDKYINICAKIHIFTLLWALMFLVEYLYSISIFFAELDQDPLPTDISQISKIFAILNKIPNFIVQTIFFQIIVFK